MWMLCIKKQSNYLLLQGMKGYWEEDEMDVYSYRPSNHYAAAVWLPRQDQKIICTQLDKLATCLPIHYRCS